MLNGTTPSTHAVEVTGQCRRGAGLVERLDAQRVDAALDGLCVPGKSARPSQAPSASVPAAAALIISSLGHLMDDLSSRS
jgi:hypothetical protein